MQIADTVPRLVGKLQTLKSRDRFRQVFGASTHDYKFIESSETEIAALEEAVRSPLPAEYRLWLLNVGYGAGPHYGLFSPRKIVSELRYNELGEGGDIPNAASLNLVDVHRYLAAVQEAGTHVGARITSNSFVGAMPVNHQGCGGYTHIVMSGALRGTMFGECGDIIGAPSTAVAAFWPEAIGRDAKHGPKPLSFFGWFENWIETSLAQLA